MIVIDGSKKSICSWPYDIVFQKKDYTKLSRGGTVPWMYISRATLLKTIRFRENVIHEDIDFTPIFLSKAESIYCVNYALYNYRRRKNSICNDGKKSEHIVYEILAVEALYDYIVQNKIPRNHFCYRYFLDSHRGLKKNYNFFPEIHTDNLDKIIKKLYNKKTYIEAEVFYFKLRVARRVKHLLVSFIEKWLKLSLVS